LNDRMRRISLDPEQEMAKERPTLAQLMPEKSI
jgi:hypothetical protein